MKKKIVLMAVILMGAAACLQAQAFKKGTNVLSAGIGFGSSIGSFTRNAQMPGLSANFERGGWEVGPGVISAGGYVGYKSFKYSDDAGSFTYTQKWNYIIIGARAAYHYTGLKSDKLDVYAGLMVSYNILNYTYKDNSGGSGSNTYGSGSFGSRPGVTGFVGGRYYFSKILGVYAELGYGVSYLNTGLSVKF